MEFYFLLASPMRGRKKMQLKRRGLNIIKEWAVSYLLESVQIGTFVFETELQ